MRQVEFKGSHNLWKGQHADDDAIIVRMPGGGLLATTVDLITPLVNDPYVFGQLTAANSMSDIYAMGGTPVFAMSILGYPGDKISGNTAARILQGAVDKAAEAGVVMAGGHTITSSEVLFGLAVVGQVTEGHILEKGGIQPGDHLVLTKPIGSGLLGSALKRGLLDPETLETFQQWLCRLNADASRAAVSAGAHAATDITGFGLLGHLWEMTQRSNVTVHVDSSKVPLYPLADQFVAMGMVPGGTRRNLKHVRPHVTFADNLPETQQLLLADAQTSGGLLIALSDSGLELFQQACSTTKQPFWVIGAASQGPAEIRVS